MGARVTPRALVLDDDPDARHQAVRSLREDGFEVTSFTTAADALDALETMPPPTLIVSDIVMPTTGGFAFRRAYAKRFPDRDTPFLFMSSLGDPDTIAAGLEAGADDYVQKPIVPSTLRARVRAVLRRQRATEAVVRGTLADFPLLGLLKFCESKALTGDVTVSAGERSVCVGFRGGEIDAVPAGELGELSESPGATFAVRSVGQAVEQLVGDLETQDPGAPVVGRLTEVRVGKGHLQTQTQVVEGMPTRVVSVIMAGDRTVAKQVTEVREPDRALVERMVASQHADVLATLQDRVASARMKKDMGLSADEPVPVSPRTMPPVGADAAGSAQPLIDEGYECYLAKDFAGAIARWEQALALDPSSKTLALNVAVLKRRVEQ
jgi:DNA-binding response OmpR family regulator